MSTCYFLWANIARIRS